MGSYTPERMAVSKAYPGNEWAKKVERMSDSQVFAIFAQLKAKGKIK